MARKPNTESGIKPKDLAGIPWRVAFALQQDGWYLRADIIWAKGISFCPTYAGSSMPESVTDRPSRTHEYVFLLTKSARYYYDVHAVKESANRGAAGSKFNTGKTAKHQLERSSDAERVETGTRNLRSVWTINPKPYPGAHFATFPPALVTPCIKAGTSEYGACATCGQPYKRFIERGAPRVEQQRASGSNADGGYTGKQAGHGRRHAGFNERYFAKIDYEAAGAQVPGATKASILAGMVDHKTLAWVPQCKCGGVNRVGMPRIRGDYARRQWYWTCWESRIIRRWGMPVPCVVLDPFSGSGTTAATAHQMGRIGIGVEPNPEYVILGLERLQSVGAI